MTAIYADPHSSAYKKAQRHYFKSSQTPPSENQSAFRAQERIYKTRFPRPSLANVLDFSRNGTDAASATVINDTLEESGWGHGFYDDRTAVPIASENYTSRALRISRIPGV
jgi:alkylated DNA repair protein alkB family protein 1